MAEKTNANPAIPQPQRKRFRNIRWRGLLVDQSRFLRFVTAAMLITVSAALSFTQFGFVGIGLQGEFQAYAIVLLLPIALGALLLGTLSGMLIGLCAGALLFLHAVVIPLDYYELKFVTPITSVLMLTIVGFILGYAFAFVLRNDPSPLKRVIYITLASMIVSGLYSFGFFINVLIELFLDMAANVDSSLPDDQIGQIVVSNIASTALYLGDLFLQFLIDGAAMALVCIVGDLITRKAMARTTRIGLRALFSTWLGVAVLFVFMVTVVTTFVLISRDEISDAETSMRSEVDYLLRQLDASDQRLKALNNFLEEEQGGIGFDTISDDGIKNFSDAISIDGLLEGYESRGNGIILITNTVSSLQESSVYLSDDEKYERGMKLSDFLDDDDFVAIRQSIDSGNAQRMVYEGGRIVINDQEGWNEVLVDNRYGDMIANTQIAYVYANQNDAYSVIVIRPSSMVFAERRSVMVFTTLSELVLLMVVFGMTAFLLSRLVMRSLDNTNEVLGRITAGDLDADVDERETRELESLSDGINETVESLKDWISEAETRMDAELSTAKAIQEAALPRIFPPYPDILKFDIYANMKAAKEVGGDFYDFFLIGDDADSEVGKLGFVIADVSGKGVPAALFMMQAKTQIRDYLQSGMEVGEAVENANRQLCDGNDAGMFVTAWVGVLDYATGYVEYVNAGHNPPLIWRFDDTMTEGETIGIVKVDGSSDDAGAESGASAVGEGSDGASAGNAATNSSVGGESCFPSDDDSTKQFGSWHWLTAKSGIPLGLFDGLEYQAYSLECQVGEQFLLYTDGVTEAMNKEDDLYGESRLMKLLSENYTIHPRRLVELVRRDVADFATGAVQSDDITILAIEVGVPPEVTSTIIVPSDITKLPEVNEFVHSELDRRLCPLRAQNQLDIAVEELFVNVCHYAYPEATDDNAGEVRVSCTYSADPPSVTVDIADDGIPYNPLAKPDAVTPDDVMEVPIGGLGILMAKRSVDEMTYKRVDGSNIVTIVKRW